MPPIKSLVSERRAYIVAVILSLSKIMPTYSRCVLKGLIYIAIIAPLGYQPSFYTKYTKLNMCLSYNIKSMSNTKCMCLMRSYILQNLQFFCLICLRVLYNSYYGETQL